jgi:DNA polymerase-1
MIVPIKNDDGEHFGAVFGFLKSLKSIVEKFKPTDVMIVTDGPNSALRRKMLFKEYKANRRKTWRRGLVKAFDFLSEEEQSSNFNFQIRRIKEYLSNFPVKTITIPYIEADDVIAEVCNTLDDKTEAIIYSTDGDYLQLLGNPNTLCYNPITKKLISKKTFIDKHGYVPENYIFIKAIEGDKSDNIPGIKGLGKKTFLKLFPKLVDQHVESINEIIDEAYHIVRSGAKGYTRGQINGYQKIIDNEDLLLRNYNIMQLMDVDISLQSRQIIKEFMEAKPNGFNRLALRKLFISDKMYSQVKYFNDWSRVFCGLIRG